MEFIDKKIKEFYETLTDQIDEENGYYDSQFAGTQPKTVEDFIRKMFKEYQEISLAEAPVMQEIAEVIIDGQIYKIPAYVKDYIDALEEDILTLKIANGIGAE